jgi:hypothetical protein
MFREQPELAGRASAGHLRLRAGVRGMPGARRLRGRRHGRGYGSQQVHAQVLFNNLFFELSLTVFLSYSFIYRFADPDSECHLLQNIALFVMLNSSNCIKNYFI